VHRADNLPPSCANCLEIWEPQPPGTLWACNGIALHFTVHGRTTKSTCQWCFLQLQHELLVNGKLLDTHIGVTEGSVLLGCCIVLLGLWFLMFWRIMQPSSSVRRDPLKREKPHAHTPNEIVSQPRKLNCSLFGKVWHFNTDWEYFPPLFIDNFCACA
jgi:hypothetical protein